MLRLQLQLLRLRLHLHLQHRLQQQAQVQADADGRYTRTRRLRVQPLQPASVPCAFRLVYRRPTQECTRCLFLAGICLPACLPACLVLYRGTGLRKLSHRPASSLVLMSCNARGTQVTFPDAEAAIHWQGHFWGGEGGGGGLQALNLGLSRPMGQMRLCFDCAVICERVGTHSHAAATTDITSSPLRTYLGAPRRICAFGHCHRRLHRTWGFVAVCGL